MQAIGRALAKEYGVRNYQMRNWMIQLGYTSAKGVLNFVDDGYRLGVAPRTGSVG